MIRYQWNRFIDDDGKMVGELRYRKNLDTTVLGQRMAAADEMYAVLCAVSDFWAGGDVPADIADMMRRALAKANGETR